jgi:hypothetical protein
MSIHPGDEATAQAHPDVELTSSAPAPPSAPKLAERGVTSKVQAGVDAGVGDGAGVETLGCPGSGAGAGDDMVGDGAEAACVSVSRTSLMRMAPIRRSVDAFAAATMTTVPSPCPFAGETWSHDD